MAAHNREELFEPLPPVLNIQVIKLVQREKDFAWKRRNYHPRGLLFKHLAECHKITVSATHAALSLLECGNVGAADDLVVCVLLFAVVGSRVCNLTR